MYLEIISPEKKMFTGEVTSVKVPGTKGSFEVLNNHASIVSTLSRGKVRVKDEQGNETSFSVKSGVIEVLKNKIIVLAETV